MYEVQNGDHEKQIIATAGGAQEDVDVGRDVVDSAGMSSLDQEYEDLPDTIPVEGNTETPFDTDAGNV